MKTYENVKHVCNSPSKHETRSFHMQNIEEYLPPDLDNCAFSIRRNNIDK